MTRYNFGGLLNPTQSGGLLSDNIYMNNVANKNMMNMMQNVMGMKRGGDDMGFNKRPRWQSKKGILSLL